MANRAEDLDNRLALSVADAALALGVSAQTIRREIDAGRLRSCTTPGGGRRLIPVPAARDWLKQLQERPMNPRQFASAVIDSIEWPESADSRLRPAFRAAAEDSWRLHLTGSWKTGAGGAFEPARREFVDQSVKLMTLKVEKIGIACTHAEHLRPPKQPYHGLIASWTAAMEVKFTDHAAPVVDPLIVYDESGAVDWSRKFPGP